MLFSCVYAVKIPTPDRQKNPHHGEVGRREQGETRGKRYGRISCHTWAVSLEIAHFWGDFLGSLSIMHTRSPKKGGLMSAPLSSSFDDSRR